MHLAWKEALKQNFDFYLWLNDDVILRNNAFEELLSCSKLYNNSAIISGIIESPDGEIIYGGSQNKKLIQPNGKTNQIENLNGNIVLVPKSVSNKIGILDPYFHHDLGDVEYGWRALINDIHVVTTRISIGVGIKNDICRLRKNKTSFIMRMRHLYSPLGSHPFINFYFKKKLYGTFIALLYFLFLHFINIIPDSINSKIFGMKYQ
jgi:GT2 family glycosyltransferase